MMKTKKGLLLLFLQLSGWALLSGASCERDGIRHDAATELLDAFEGACVSGQGDWTKRALAQNEALISVLQKLQDNDACSSVVSALSSIEALNYNISILLKDGEYEEHRTSEERLQELILALNAATDPNLILVLQEAILEEKVTLATSKAAKSSSYEIIRKDRFAESTRLLSSYTQQLLFEADGISECLAQSPAASVKILNSLLAIGGSFVAPVYGASIATVGQMLNVSVDYARRMPIEKRIYELHSRKMPTALNCALEAMTSFYCSANDTFDLIDVQQESYLQPTGPPETLWRGIDLVGRRMPILNRWLLKVRTGIEPQSSLDADLQNDVWRKINYIDNIGRTVIGEINDAAEQINAPTTNVSQKTILTKNLVLSLVVQITHHASGNAFIDLDGNPRAFACWIVLGSGPGISCPSFDNSQGFEIPLEPYIVQELFGLAGSPSTEKIRENWLDLVQRANELIQIEFSQTITIDPEVLIAAAFEQGATDDIRPVEALRMVLAFLVDFQSRSPQQRGRRIELIEETIQLVRSALNVIEDSSSARTSTEEVTAVFAAFRLRDGIQFFNERINRLVQWDLNDQLAAGGFSEQVENYLLWAGSDLRERLEASGVTDIKRIQLDLNEARRLTHDNIESFVDHFGPYLDFAVAHLRSQELKFETQIPSGSNRPYGEILGKLCTLILVSRPNWPDSVDWSHCENAKIYPSSPQADQSEVIELRRLRVELDGQSQMDRMCTFHRFLRADRLREVLDSRLLGPQAFQGRAVTRDPRPSASFFWPIINPKARL